MTSILVIDDDNMQREVFVVALRNNGYDVTEASDGERGLTEYRKKPFDLVITDILMPEKDGTETILELKTLNADVKILAVSGGGMWDKNYTLQMAKDLGADATLEKPIKVQVLLDTVSDLLNG